MYSVWGRRPPHQAKREIQLTQQTESLSIHSALHHTLIAHLHRAPKVLLHRAAVVAIVPARAQLPQLLIVHKQSLLAQQPLHALRVRRSRERALILIDLHIQLGRLALLILLDLPALRLEQVVEAEGVLERDILLGFGAR